VRGRKAWHEKCVPLSQAPWLVALLSYGDRRSIVQSSDIPRLGVDIGGTFTDAALEIGGKRFTTKVLTTTAAPEQGVLTSITAVMAQAGSAPAALGLIIHGTTLATNALIERKGARTALLTTEGFRDVLEIRGEDRYEQYALKLEVPSPLVPRRWRFPVRERIDAQGKVRIALAEQDIAAVVPRLREAEIEAVAIGFLHSYVNPVHERRAGELLAAAMPGLAISLSCEVSPEMREYERFSTACANAYVQPRMASYLRRLEQALRDAGYRCPLMLMASSGALTTLETSERFPVRLVESGPAGGAIFASQIAAQSGLDEVLSFDMGGTTAKICLIEHSAPQSARSFEVARVYRFKKGSGLPLRIPVIEMVEIGAGGGSIARIDALRRIAVGPDSAGSEPGPACYGRGGTAPTVTDADVILGRIAPEEFSGGSMRLDRPAAARAVDGTIGAALGLPLEMAAFGIGEMVDENMANAARVHAIESGKDVSQRALIAFGGAAPLHVARVAEKLRIDRFLVPTSAGVGSAVGFLRASVAYEIVRSLYQRLDTFDLPRVNAVLQEMTDAARQVVATAALGEALSERRLAYMRYVGQGHEIAVALPAKPLTEADLPTLAADFAAEYRRLYSRTVPGAAIELLTWTVLIAAPAPVSPVEAAATVEPYRPTPSRERALYDEASGTTITVPVHWRPALRPGAIISGPAIIAEDETTTIVTAAFEATIDPRGAIDCRRVTTGDNT
jgi:N-methylhydantoinase A